VALDSRTQGGQDYIVAMQLIGRSRSQADSASNE
jgi:hypothetical protein